MYIFSTTLQSAVMPRLAWLTVGPALISVMLIICLRLWIAGRAATAAAAASNIHAETSGGASSKIARVSAA